LHFIDPLRTLAENPNMNFKLEICTDSLESAIEAQQAGADRIELCDNLMEGGTTPSFGNIILARQNLNIAIHVIIRPRGGDFLYSPLEYEIMKRDIEVCRESGVNGIVTGILTPDGRIDVDRTRELVNLAHPMHVTFHRAFDMCSDPCAGLEDVIRTGCSRLLTSGHKNKVTEGSGLVAELVRQAKDRIIVMPGSGIDDSNIESLARSTGAVEFHLTGRKTVESMMSFSKHDISMGGIPGIPEYSRKVADREKIQRIITILKTI
jgi:copper homeostasis protein